MGIVPPATTNTGVSLHFQRRFEDVYSFIPAGAIYHGYSSAAKAGATSRQDAPKRKMVVTRNIPRKIVRPVPPW